MLFSVILSDQFYRDRLPVPLINAILAGQKNYV